ncbi:hypothetical protein MTO96_001678 [Rhipicephalus appendiculatus]
MAAVVLGAGGECREADVVASFAFSLSQPPNVRDSLLLELLLKRGFGPHIDRAVENSFLDPAPSCDFREKTSTAP